MLVEKLPALETSGFDTYFKYIYGGGIRTSRFEENIPDVRTLRLIKSWSVGNTLQDEKFKTVIIQELAADVKNLGILPEFDSMGYLFGGPNQDDPLLVLQEFFLEIFAVKRETEEKAWYSDVDDDLWVRQFLKRLTNVLTLKSNLEGEGISSAPDDEIDRIVEKFTSRVT